MNDGDLVQWANRIYGAVEFGYWGDKDAPDAYDDATLRAMRDFVAALAAGGHEMTDPEPNREPKMDSSAPQRDAGRDRAWDEGTPAGESGPRPSRTDVDPGAGRAQLNTDGWLVWSPQNVARLFLDEQHNEARAFAFQVLGALYRIELVERFS